MSRFIRDLTSRPLVAAIPVRDEAERIGACLAALARQRGAALDHVVLLLNNCTDDTAARARALAASLPYQLSCVERLYAKPFAHAGTARREAMEIAARLAGPDGILFTTDADGAAAPGWLAANLAALAQGAEVVCGRAEIDPVEALAIPAHLHEDDAVEVAYATALDHIHDLVDPDPLDPWPRHTEHSGASIAVTVAAWALAGGVPALPAGEDRGFLQALRLVDLPIRHAPDAVVTVSGRIVGRAPGGMAETMARRIRQQDAWLDDALEPAADCLRRARARADLRRLYDRAHCAGGAPDRSLQLGSAHLARRTGLPVGLLAHWLQEPHFGLAWARLEAQSPALIRRRVLRRDLAMQACAAEAIIAGLLGQALGQAAVSGEAERLPDLQAGDRRRTAGVG